MSEEIIYKQVPIGKRFHFWRGGTSGAIIVEVYDGEIQFLQMNGYECRHNLPKKCDWSEVRHWLSETIELDEKKFKEMASLLSEDSRGFNLVQGIICNRIREIDYKLQKEKSKWNRYL